MEEKVYLKEKEFPMPVKKIKPTDPNYLNEKEIEEYMRSIDVIRPWETMAVDTTSVIGAPSFVISKTDPKKKPKEVADREGMFFNIIQYKYSCDIKNGRIGKNSLANFTTYIKDTYSYSYPAFVLEKLKRVDKAMAKEYAAEFKAELAKLYAKKIAGDTKEFEKYRAEAKETEMESKAALSRIKA
jgi:hypothetical protein